jgi:transketolase
MRPKFFQLLYEAMKTNKDIWLLVGDLGFGGADKIREEFPDRFINCGAAEFSMVGIAAGLALEGKIPVCYTITPFYFRAFEMIRTYIDYEKIPVILIGSGRGDDYKHDGFSHYAGDDYILKEFKNIHCCWSDTIEEMESAFISALKDKFPTYINLRR